MEFITLPLTIRTNLLAPRPCHACNVPYFIKDCNEVVCLRCKPKLDNHSPAKYPRKHPSSHPVNNNTPYRHNTRKTHEASNYTEPNLQLSVSTSKPDQMTKLLETTRRMTQYIKKSIKDISSHTKNQ